jgi:hypothetical protein
MFLWIFCSALGLLTIISVYFIFLAANYIFNQFANPNVAKIFEYVIIALCVFIPIISVCYFPTIFFHYLFAR